MHNIVSGTSSSLVCVYAMETFTVTCQAFFPHKFSTFKAESIHEIYANKFLKTESIPLPKVYVGQDWRTNALLL